MKDKVQIIEGGVSAAQLRRYAARVAPSLCMLLSVLVMGSLSAASLTDLQEAEIRELVGSATEADILEFIEFPVQGDPWGVKLQLVKNIRVEVAAGDEIRSICLYFRFGYWWLDNSWGRQILDAYESERDKELRKKLWDAYQEHRAKACV